MPRQVKALLYVACVLGFIYLLGAFAAASFDISQWSEVGRVIASGLGGILGFSAFIIAMDLEL
jgi:hypothetical protein